jgi:eukaryotic-like serine/threonine-protein kinase
LERYEIVRPIAEGGMGSVWLGRLRGKHGFEKLVAIKTIRATHASDSHFRTMFLEEARLAARVEHPNVAHVIDLGDDGERLFLVMEWVDGHPLDIVVRRLAQRRMTLPVRLALRVVADACAGVHAAHEVRGPGGERLGIVHRDISPQNILLTEAGVVKVIDFGIARAVDGLVREAGARNVGGKVAYMAPEQALAKIIDHRADIWSLGAVLHELVAGAPAVHAIQDLTAVIDGRRDVAALPSSVPPEACAIVRRAMAVSPRLRFENALEMQRAIEHAIAALATSTPTGDLAQFLAEHVPSRIAHAERETATWHVATDEAEARTADTSPSSAVRSDPRGSYREPRGRAVAVAGNQEEETAIRRALSTTFDVVVGDLSDVLDAQLVVLGTDEARHLVAAPEETVVSVRVALVTASSLEAARSLFNRGALDGVVPWPTSDDILAGVVSASLARAQRRARSSANERRARIAQEASMRALIDGYSSQLDEMRRTSSREANAERLRTIGELEIRRARASEAPLSMLVYCMRRPTLVTPSSELALVHAVIDSGAAVITEQHGEVVALVPGEHGDALRARTAEQSFRVGRVGVAELSAEDTFDGLLDRARDEAGERWSLPFEC